MAETVHLTLKANGKTIQGDSTQASNGRDKTIECVSYEQAGTVPTDANGASAGRRQYSPVSIRKRVDRASPLLWKAMTENSTIDGDFKFYRPSPAGDGTTEQFYTVNLKQGRISGIRQYVPDTLASNSTEPPMEEVSFVFHTITWTFNDGGIQHEDSWKQNR
jgi:type VI secretion system secreted protein Hcp